MRIVPLALTIAFLVVPVLEIYVIIQVGGLIGVLPTVVLLLAVSVLGAWVIRREGLRAWTKLRQTLDEGRMPDRELANAALVLVGGTLLLTPGFVTDVTGFCFVLPPTRALVRRALTGWFKRRIRVMGEHAMSQARAAGTGPTVAGGHWPHPDSQHRPGQTNVVHGEVIDDDQS